MGGGGLVAMVQSVQTKKYNMNPLTEKLRYHVSGAIERGESQAIAGIPMKETHTPGPWYLAHHKDSSGNQSIDIRHCCDIPPSAPEIHQIASLPENAFANALLIAAAPELLSALETIVSSYGELMRSKGAKSNLGQDFSAADWLGSRLGGHIAKAEDLIMRAKGEA